MSWNNLSFTLEKIYNQDEIEFNPLENNQTQCIICLDRVSDCILIPCRHMCLCQKCMEDIKKKNQRQGCPLCKRKVDNIVIYVDR